MANTILIMGESGSGKTTSLRNLDPHETVYIDCDGKGLAWRGWKAQYNTQNKNYICTNDKNQVLAMLKHINADMPEVKYVVIDTLNAIMLQDERERKNEKSYQGWTDLAWAIWDILECALNMRDDMFVIFTAHTQTDQNELGYKQTHMKTSGRKLEKIVPESKVRTVLNSKCVDGEYVYITRDETSTVKDGVCGEMAAQIPNDITHVIEAVREFDGEVA